MATQTKSKNQTKITRKGKGRLATLAKNKNVIIAAKLVGYGGALGLLVGCASGAGTLAYRAIAG